MRVSICLLAVLLLVACATTVNLTVKNPTEVSQSPRVVILSDKNIEQDKDTINLGTLVPHKDTQRSFKVKHSYNVVVKSITGQDYGAWESAPYTIPKKPDPFPIVVDLGFNGTVIPNDSRAIDQIRNALLDLGPNVGFKPIDIHNALSTWFGSLVVMIPPLQGQPERILHQVEPNNFCRPATTMDQFRYPETSSQNEVKVIGKSSANLAANVPVYGSIGVNLSADNLYNVSWTMNGFGMVNKQDPDNWSYVQAIESLSDKEKRTIQEAMQQNPSAVMLYVNQIYVIKNADFAVTESKKLAAGSKLSVLSFVTADGAWTFENAHTSHQQFQELVLNVGGITLPASIVKERALAGSDIYQVVRGPEMVQKKYFISGAVPSNTP
ncbi:MAG: hypothetical protein ABSB22_26825 [Thermodesulfobacteriota bacterium]